MFRADRRSNSRLAWCAAIAALLCLPVAAADFVVDFDHEYDFSAIHTFALRSLEMGIRRPETQNPIVTAQVTDAIRAALVARGLQEATAGADVVVDWQLRGQGMVIGPGGQARPTNYGQGGNEPGSQPLTFVEATLVVDISEQHSGLLIWRGVLRNRDRDAGEVARNLSGYAKKLLDGYPRRRR
jgi:hypothetical protein